MADFANYFDYAAATPMLDDVLVAMHPYFIENFYNPSAIYLAARHNKQILDQTRHKFAQGIGARPTEIVFTAGGTEANNLAIKGIIDTYPGGHAVTTAVEHDSVLLPVSEYDHTLVAVDDHGFVDPLAIVGAITDRTVIVSVMYANNEIGSIQPIKKIADCIAQIKQERVKRKIQLPLYFHTDACQASNYLDMQVSRLGVDLLTMNSGKIYGPKQCAALYVRAGIKLKPQILGGGQEWGFRSGTENLANIIGFSLAWDIAKQSYHNEVIRLTKLRDEFIANILKQNQKITLNGPTGKRRLANNIHITIDGYDNERLLMELDEKGFQIATGSACSASNDEPSHVLKAIGLSDNRARNSIRITLGKYTTENSLNDLKNTLLSIIK
jgi:cysteine desulfurase